MQKIIRALVCAVIFGPAAALAQQHGTSEPFIFGVNEGVTYRVTPHETRERYKEIGELLAKTLKRPVKIVPEDNYPRLRKSLEAKAFDLAYVHPAHHSLRAIRDQGYRFIAITKGWDQYKARFLARPNASYSPQDVLVVKMVMPDPDSITAWMVRATLRDMGADQAKLSLGTTRYQDGIPFMMENGFYDVGITAAGAVVKEWQAKGGKVIFESRPVPIKHLIASPNVTAEEAEKIRAVFLGLETTKEGQAILEKLGFKGFLAPDEAQAARLTKWLGI